MTRLADVLKLLLYLGTSVGLYFHLSCTDALVGYESGPWQTLVTDFASLDCEARRLCGSRQPFEECLASTQASLTPVGYRDTESQQRCLQCLLAKRAHSETLIETLCDTIVDYSDIYFWCDVDPMSDFDGDGDPQNDQSEACADI